MPLRLLASAFCLMCAALTAAQAGDDRLALGKEVFQQISQPQCGVCHKLQDAGAEGELGPSLDALKPSEEQVRTAVTLGVGVMPAFEDLSQEQIDAVAAYVASVTGGTGD